MQPGIYDLTNDEYHASAGISRSGISELKKSPLHYWDRYINPDKKAQKGKKAFYFGSLVHTLILEPHLFESDYIIMPQKFDLRKKEDKAKKAEFDATVGDRVVIEKESYETALLMSNEVLNHPNVPAILNGALIEKSLYWIDEDTGMLCKTRPDIWNEQIAVLCDLKTAADASIQSFLYEAKDYDYAMQAAMQIDGIFNLTGLLTEQYCFLVVPKEPPYKPYIYSLDANTIEYGRRVYKDGLKLAKICQEKNCWDLDRNRPHGIGFSEFLLNSNPFNRLLEVYECQI